MKRPAKGSTLDVAHMQTPPTDKFEAGENVEAKIEGWSRYYPGVIEKDNGNDSYIVLFNDGERIHQVMWDEIKRIIPGRR